MMTIVHLIPGLFLGGTEKVLEIIVNHQITLGYKVGVICFEETKFEKFFSNIPVIHCAIKYKQRLIRKSEIDLTEYEAAIDRINPAYIHSHSYWTDLISHRNLRREVHYITHFHLFYPVFENINLSRMFSRAIFPWIDKQRLLYRYGKGNCSFIAVSEFIRQFYEKRFPGRISDKIEVISNPVDDKYFLVERRNIRYDLLTIGRLEAIKNQSFLLQVLVRARERGLNFSLAIVGEGSLKERLAETVEKNGLSHNVFFLGGIKDLSGVFSTSGIYVQASFSETFGLTMMEAMAAGLPVIVNKFEGIDGELFVDGHNCKVITNQNTDAFIDAIVFFKSDLAAAKNISDNGRKTSARFSSSIFLKKIQDYYTELDQIRQNK